MVAQCTRPVQPDPIAKRFQLPASDLPDLRDYEPDEAAQALRMDWDIGVRPIGNLVHLLEAKGVAYLPWLKRGSSCLCCDRRRLRPLGAHL